MELWGCLKNQQGYESNVVTVLFIKDYLNENTKKSVFYFCPKKKKKNWKRKFK